MMFKNIQKITFLLVISALLFSCNSPGKTQKSEIKKGVAPIADNEVAIIEMEEPIYGKFKMELYSNIAPEMVKRFKDLAREGFYNGLAFHRINATVIQSGDPYSKETDNPKIGSGGSNKPDVPAEFSDVPYDTAIVGAARSENINSANSQFFIMLKREAGFDQKYTIFGKVVEGMGNVRTIAGAPRDMERPLEQIKIKSITIQPK